MMSIKCPSPSLLVDFCLKSILLDIRITIPACFLGPVDWKTFPTLYSEVISVFEVEVCFLHTAKGGSLCLFIGELGPLMLRDINDQ